eukprot:TRINITY_DN568_c1_g2_i3.p1 TRINITY_DN568_c1_g2~~TRINITY_DN568_c1_g2_i3.p1  ORF type:complete len:961 (+),score=366.71 TRINITY_DN568_c1_g2_i3:183-3065(+)
MLAARIPLAQSRQLLRCNGIAAATRWRPLITQLELDKQSRRNLSAALEHSRLADGSGSQAIRIGSSSGASAGAAGGDLHSSAAAAPNHARAGQDVAAAAGEALESHGSSGSSSTAPTATRPLRRRGLHQIMRQLRFSVRFRAQARRELIDDELWAEGCRLVRHELTADPLSVVDGDAAALNELAAVCAEAAGRADAPAAPRAAPAGQRTETGAEMLAAAERRQAHDAQLRAREERVFERHLAPRVLAVCRDIGATRLALRRRMAAAGDMRAPHEWYPVTRLSRRRIIYHGGPTNSGKTYTAIQRLKGANKEHGGGVFCGPLRLLALEIYEKLNREGIYTNLFTGQERRIVPFATHTACTIEMVSTDVDFDVAVIDEIQMIGNAERGPAWTRALLGLRAREVHVCGGMEGVDVVRRLCAQTGDHFELHEYERKTPLAVAPRSLDGDYSRVQPGDCVVAFSKDDIFAIRRRIEETTSLRCCVVFGALPSETRSQQARLFNDDDTGYDVLVASDAIGMGLNLNIRRIIFHTVIKRGARGTARVIEPTLLKQIAGRAGRMSSKWDTGEVTAFTEDDMRYIRETMVTPLLPLKTAGIFPALEHVNAFVHVLGDVKQAFVQTAPAAATPGSSSSSAPAPSAMTDSAAESESSDEERSATVTTATSTEAAQAAATAQAAPSIATAGKGMAVLAPGLPLGQVFDKLVEHSTVEQNLFFMGYYKQLRSIADTVSEQHGLSLEDCYNLSMAPVNTSDEIVLAALRSYVAAYAARRPAPLNVFLPAPGAAPRSLAGINELCSKHQALDLYLWLANRFPECFKERKLAEAQRGYAQQLITTALLSTVKAAGNDKDGLEQAGRYRRALLSRSGGRLPPSMRSSAALPAQRGRHATGSYGSRRSGGGQGSRDAPPRTSRSREQHQRSSTPPRASASPGGSRGKGGGSRPGKGGGGGGAASTQFARRPVAAVARA